MNELLEKQRRTHAQASSPTHCRSTDVFEELNIRPSFIEREKVRTAVAINATLALRGATQAQRAQALGVSQPIVSNLERLELAGISLERLMRYADHLGLSPEVRFSAQAAESSRRK